MPSGHAVSLCGTPAFLMIVLYQTIISASVTALQISCVFSDLGKILLSAGHQTGLGALPLNQGRVGNHIQMEIRIMHNGTGSGSCADVGSGTAGAAGGISHQRLIAVHTGTDIRGQLSGFGIQIFQLTGIRIDDVNPGILIVQNGSELNIVLQSFLLLPFFQQEHRKHIREIREHMDLIFGPESFGHAFVKSDIPPEYAIFTDGAL